MGKINYGRVILGGMVAGIVYDILDWLIDGVWLAPAWAHGMRALGRSSEIAVPEMVWLNLIGIAGGIMAVWIYAAIRPRFGPGVRTAVYAGLVCWFLSVLLANAAFMYAMGLFGRRLTLYSTLGGIVEIVVATIAGAAFYREASGSSSAQPVATEKSREAMRA